LDKSRSPANPDVILLAGAKKVILMPQGCLETLNPNRENPSSLGELSLISSLNRFIEPNPVD
jgi:hypothetical protein